MNKSPERDKDSSINASIEVGSFFLETLTTGMYEDPFHCIREYIQNSFDAIQDAVRAGLLREGEGRILISVGGTSRAPALLIRDNGVGIPSSRAFTTLVSLGASRKSPNLHAGFRGIGRLAGIAYCTTLRFTTSVSGDDSATIVEFDCGHIRSYFSPGADPVDVRDVVRSSVRTRLVEANISEHFTQVEMIHLVNVGTEFVEIGRLQPYLKQVCPVDYPNGFDFGDRIRRLADGFGNKLSIVHVEIRQKRELLSVLKPYKNIYPTGRKNFFSKIHDIQVFTSKEHGWFGWVGVSNFPGEIVDEAAAGIRFRVKNIQVGNAEIIENIAEELTSAGTDRRLQPWAIGEIFLSNTEVIPNARRDGFEDNRAWREVRSDIKEKVVKRVIKLVRSASVTRTALKSISDSLKRIENEVNKTMTEEVKSGYEIQIKRYIQTLGSPDKLVGADPKDISFLSSKFKELLEKLALVETIDTVVDTTVGESKHDVNDPEDEEQENGQTTVHGGSSSSRRAEDEEPTDPPTRESIILAILLMELPLKKAQALTELLITGLEDAGL